MKAVGYQKSLPVEDANSLLDFETAKPEPKGRDIRVAVKAISANPVDYKVRSWLAQRQEVLAFTQARGPDGGAGSFKPPALAGQP